MSLKYLAELTGLAMLAQGVRENAKERVLQAGTKNLDVKSLTLPQESEFSLRAPGKCSLALQRGFYFSLRLPDWARDFKQQTQEILNQRYEAPKNAQRNYEDPKLPNKSKQLRPDRYGTNISESGIFFEDITRGMPMKPDRPMRMPKIKDDVTCGKRVFHLDTRPSPV